MLTNIGYAHIHMRKFKSIFNKIKHSRMALPNLLSSCKYLFSDPFCRSVIRGVDIDVFDKYLSSKST